MKKKQVLIILTIILILLIIVIARIIINVNKPKTSINDFSSVREMVEFDGHTYISMQDSTEEGYDKDIYISFSKPTVNDDGGTNKNLYEIVISHIAGMLKGQNFRLIDTDKNVVVKIQFDGNKNVNFYSFYAKISNVGLSALSLLEDNFLDNTYPICRNIIELYVEFIVLLSCPSAIEKYNYLSSVEFGKSSYGQEYPEKFLDLYKNRINKKETRKNMFLHFGWVDNIPNYHKIVKNNPYSINGLITFLESVDQSYENYGIFYRRCHSYTHANVVGIKYPLLSYFEICIMLYMTIFNTYTVLCEKLKIDSKINDIDIVSKIEKDIKLLESQYMKMSTENFENYHKNTIN